MVFNLVRVTVSEQCLFDKFTLSINYFCQQETPTFNILWITILRLFSHLILYEILKCDHASIDLHMISALNRFTDRFSILCLGLKMWYPCNQYLLPHLYQLLGCEFLLLL